MILKLYENKNSSTFCHLVLPVCLILQYREINIISVTHIIYMYSDTFIGNRFSIDPSVAETGIDTFWWSVCYVVFICTIRSHVLHFWVTAGLHNSVGNLYWDALLLPLLTNISLLQLVELLDSPLHNYFKQRDCLNYFFCFRWVLIQFKRLDFLNCYTCHCALTSDTYYVKCV